MMTTTTTTTTMMTTTIDFYADSAHDTHTGPNHVSIIDTDKSTRYGDNNNNNNNKNKNKNNNDNNYHCNYKPTQAFPSLFGVQ